MIRLLLALVLACLVAMPASAQAVRENVNDLSAAEVEALRRGVRVMKSRDNAPRNSADFRRSWAFWANAHAHFGADCRGPVTGGGMTGVRAWTATNAAENAAWCGCIHGTDEFLTWHRMFVWYFERVLAQAAGVPSLRLPFWDVAADRSLPAIFRSPTYRNASGATVPNPLYAAARRVNDGRSLSPAVTSSANAMLATTYPGFRVRIEATPHGAVHCAIAGGCPNGLMGAVPSAGLDPIFWIHHANIDRLYDCWLSRGPGRLPTSAAILDARHAFVDRDGSVVTRTARAMLRSSTLGYTYAAGSSCGAANATMAMAEALPGPVMEPMRIVPTPATDGRLVLHIEAHYDPAVLFEVFVTRPTGSVSVGMLSGFGAEHHGAGTAEFDITDAVADLGAVPGQQIGVALVPTDGVEPVSAPDPMLGRVTVTAD